MPELSVVAMRLVDEPREVLRSTIPHAQIVELAESIRALGLLQPIGVYAVDGRYRVVFGHRRLLAHRWLGRDTIEAKVLSAEEAEALKSAVAENVVRADLTAVEEARAVRQMLEVRGKSVPEVAAALGKSESWVRQRREILFWPEEIVAAVDHGSLSVSVARELVAVDEVRVRAHYMQCAIDSGCTAAQMRQWRGDWEMQRSLNPEPDLSTLGQGPPPEAVLPTVHCQLCDEEHLITGVFFMKTCPACHEALIAQKHAARVERRMAGGG